MDPRDVMSTPFGSSPDLKLFTCRSIHDSHEPMANTCTINLYTLNAFSSRVLKNPSCDMFWPVWSLRSTKQTEQTEWTR